jgi:murein DD-endopeptidase MepM/ murein hydrolase activator NlpD
MKRGAMFVLLVLACSVGFTPIGLAQNSSAPAAQTPSGFFYPIWPTGGLTLGFHRVAGAVSSTATGFSAFGGHFMSPGPQKKDFHTGEDGRYFDNLYHNGMDIFAPYGTPVYAIADGWVDNQNTFSTASWSSDIGAVGRTENIGLVVSSFSGTGQTFKTVYGHIEKSTTTLNNAGAINTWVKAGSYIGKIGMYGRSSHLHFGIHLGDGDVSITATQGWGRDAISTWPDRLGWVDPVMFIESQCPLGIVCYANKTNDLVAESDMKEQMVGKYNPTLVTSDSYFSFLYSDAYFEQRHGWFYAIENNHIHWHEVWHATDFRNRNIRWILYMDYDTKACSPWIKVVVIP